MFRSTEHPQPSGISSQEFGVSLFTTITLIGGIMQLREYRGRVAMGVLEPRADYLAQEVKLKEQLKTALVHLSADDVTSVLQRYPWVASC